MDFGEHSSIPDQTSCSETKGADQNGTTDTSENGNVAERFIPAQSNNPFCSIQREAALTKFRMKSKERCNEKKVWYESRKKLADRRPRVKGQFIRRMSSNPPPANPVAACASADA